ncbi:LysR family transcriptional regulator [Luteimonas sp. XNQY3]|nr:LysR family transcriptional regulator [Luteimonas sp. XNQY3]MCD9007834.1 LysR family transcriptional regulator [Luteimonas sp. XNQY3]
MDKLLRNSLRQIDVQDILVFLAILDLGNTRKVSHKLRVSQSTVSYCLKRLRMCFADRLFVSGQHGMAPTAKAEAIAPYLKTIITSINRCARPEQELLARTARKIVRICAPEYFELLLLPRVARGIIDGPVRCAVHVERLQQEIPTERLLAGQLDLACGFGPGYHHIHPDLDREALVSDSFVCLTSRRAGTATPLTVNEFCAVRHAFPTPWDSPTNIFDAWLDRIDRTRNVALRTTSYQSCLNALPGSDLMLTLPRRLLPRLLIPEGVNVCEPPLGFPSFTLDLIWPREREWEGLWLRQLVKDGAAKLR